MGSQHPLELRNVQGDILEGLGKKNELFYFFRVRNGHAHSFGIHLRQLIPLVTSTAEAKRFHDSIVVAKKEAARQGRPCALIENSGVNIAFSQKGLTALGIIDDIGDDLFKKGMLADAEPLGDNVSEWDAKFQEAIHGVILITANSKLVLERTLHNVERIFRIGQHDASIEEVTRLLGQTRPGKEEGREHFGFEDGLSQPAVQGIDAGVTSEPMEKPVRQGVILLGREGDNGNGIQRPTWALDGSFLAFRYLKQLVPEFDAFLEANAPKMPFPSAPEDPTGAEFLGARLVGRWKSGAPIDLTPLRDDPSLATREDFRFDPKNQERCPFAAHIRKMNPRSDLDAFGGTEIRRILRRGITFGPEVTEEEKQKKTSSDDKKLERGLLFVSYQSNLANGFHFLQESWANNASFPPTKAASPPVQKPGIDPIIGVATPREMVGASPDIARSNEVLDFAQRWVISRGGEYFFSPSISALRTRFSTITRPSEHHEL